MKCFIVACGSPPPAGCNVVLARNTITGTSKRGLDPREAQRLPSLLNFFDAAVEMSHNALRNNSRFLYTLNVGAASGAGDGRDGEGSYRRGGDFEWLFYSEQISIFLPPGCSSSGCVASVSPRTPFPAILLAESLAPYYEDGRSCSPLILFLQGALRPG